MLIYYILYKESRHILKGEEKSNMLNYLGMEKHFKDYIFKPFYLVIGLLMFLGLGIALVFLYGYLFIVNMLFSRVKGKNNPYTDKKNKNT
jgi:hypothetical protein